MEVFANARGAARSREEALANVARWLMRETAAQPEDRLVAAAMH
jgi:hypothetical protein